MSNEIPPYARCSFCHSWQPAIRLECQVEDDYTQLYRFWCDWNCHAKWGTNQPGSADEKKGKGMVQTGLGL